MAVVADRFSPTEIADFYEKRIWLRDSLFDMIENQAAQRGASRFIFDDHRSLTFAGYRDEVIRLAVGLRRMNLQPGDRVAVQLPNWVEFAVAAAAIARAGGVVVPIMPIYRDDEVEYVLRHSGATLAITCDTWKGFSHRAMFSQLLTRCTDLAHVLVARSDPSIDLDGTSSLDRHLPEGAVDDLIVELGPDPGPDEGFLIVYTSGTTARPKGCFHTVNTVRASAIAIAQCLEVTSADVQFGPSPITHSTGLMTSVILPLLAGAQSYLMESWSPEAAIARVAEHGCTVTVTATAFLQMFLGDLHDSADARSLRQWVCAGSPIPGAVVDRARRELSGCQVLSLYGRSESFLNAMCATDDSHPRCPRAPTVGRAVVPSCGSSTPAEGKSPVVRSETSPTADRVTCSNTSAILCRRPPCALTKALRDRAIWDT